MTAITIEERITTSSYAGTDLVAFDPIAAPRAAFVAKIRALAEHNAATETPIINEYINDLDRVRSGLLDEAQAFLASPEVSANGYVKDIAIEHTNDALDDVARIDALITRLITPTEAEGEQL